MYVNYNLLGLLSQPKIHKIQLYLFLGKQQSWFHLRRKIELLIVFVRIYLNYILVI